MHGIVVGIDASRIRSGGGKAHLIGLLNYGDPNKYNIRQVHIWASQTLNNSINDYPWLIKHSPQQLDMSLSIQLLWQRNSLIKELKNTRCNILFAADASTLCRFRPMVVLSQDMLSYEPGIMSLYGYSKARIRLLAILLLQNRAFKYADGVIFLTKYAAKTIQKSCGYLRRIAYIPHGIGEDFKLKNVSNIWPEGIERPIQCLYVSNTALYKYQWIVVQAITKLKNNGYNITLKLVGGGTGKAQQLLDHQISISDPDHTFIKQSDFVAQSEISTLLASADIFVFASACENMPVTLLEAMAVGLPIACANRGPMQEVLADAGVYFDPEDAESIADAVEQIINDPNLRVRIAQKAKILSDQYSWSRCANETWAFIADTYINCKK